MNRQSYHHRHHRIHHGNSGSTPYAWLTGLNGTLGRDPVLVDIDKSFLDIAEVLKMAAALQIEVRNGRWAIMADGFYAALGSSVDARSPLSGNGKLDLKQFLGELDLAYRIHEDTRSFVDLFAGARYNSLKLDIEIDATTPGGGENLSASASADGIGRIRSSASVASGTSTRGGSSPAGPISEDSESRPISHGTSRRPSATNSPTVFHGTRLSLFRHRLSRW